MLDVFPIFNSIRMECYNNIFGFSAQPCTCTADSRPADYSESKSGLFLDEVVRLNAISGDCDKTLWDVFEASRKTAISKFIADSNLLLEKNYTPKRAQA